MVQGHRISRCAAWGAFKAVLDEEVDETFIGGKARNTHVRQRCRRIAGRGMVDNTAVVAGGCGSAAESSRPTSWDNRKKPTVHAHVKKRVAAEWLILIATMPR